MLRVPGMLQPCARHTQSRHVTYQRLRIASLFTRARKQAEERNVEIDLAPDGVLPADLQKLSKLAKAELQQHLEARGLDKHGNKEELANRLLDNLIAQESVLSSTPPDRIKLQQQLDGSVLVARRSRRTSRKATTSAEPIPDSASSPDSSTASASGVEQPNGQPAGRRRQRTSRRITSSADPIPSPVDADAAAAAALNTTETRPAGRARRTSRKATVSTDPLPSAAEMAGAPTASGDILAATKTPRCSRRTSRTATTSNDPSDMQQSAHPSTTTTEGADLSSASQTAAPARKRGRRTSTKTTSTNPVTAQDSTPAAEAVGAEAHAPTVSPAKQLAQQLAQKEIAAHGMAAAAASSTTWVASDDLLSAGSQAQSDNLLMAATKGMQAAGAQSTFSVDNGSVDEVMAQLAGERASGLSDEPALRPEALLAADGTSSAGSSQQVHQGSALADIVAAADSAAALFMQSLVEGSVAVEAGADISDRALTAFDHMTPPPSAGAADAAASWSGAVATSPDDVQHPSMADCVAAVEEPLTASADLLEQDEDADAVMAAFDHTTLDSAAAAAVANGNQVPSLQDIATALPASSLPAALDEAVGEDEVADVTLEAFDHVLPDTPCTEAAATRDAVMLADALEDGPAGYDQPYLDPLQPSAFDASVGSGSVDMAGSKADGLAQNAEAEKQVQQETDDLGAMVQRWWASVVQMFEAWQKNLSGPK